MDTLDDTTWDVVISGTGLKQSLLALALSRSGKKILHIDRNSFYGGDEAALSLAEAEAWASQHSSSNASTYSHASIEADAGKELGPARSYSLALAPQLIFARANLIPALVSSRVHEQLEFQAVGSWFVIDNGGLVKVPNGREDIFQDSSLELRAKRALMKFIRHISDPDLVAELSEETSQTHVPVYLQDFGIPAAAHAPIMALTLSPDAPNATRVGKALPNVIRHLQSIGMFGPGFGALLPKWGGLAEVAQVACRAGAVGGGFYVLNRGINEISVSEGVALTLSDGEKVKTTWLAGDADELKLDQEVVGSCTRAIYIVSSPLSALFSPTSEGGVTPAGAVVAVPAGPDEVPVFILAHSSDSGQVPSGKCVLHAAVLLPIESGRARLDAAVASTLKSLDEHESIASWSMHFQHNRRRPLQQARSENIVAVEDSGFEIALSDSILEEVRDLWRKITNEDAEAFMKFESREGAADDDGYE